MYKKLSVHILSAIMGLSPLVSMANELGSIETAKQKNVQVSASGTSGKAYQLGSSSTRSMKQYQSTSPSNEISDSVTSQAFNYSGQANYQVDSRTGSLSLSFDLAELWSNGPNGEVLPLTINYNGSRQKQVYGATVGWSFAIPHIDIEAQQAVFPNSGFHLLDNGATLQYGLLQNKQFGFKRNTDGSGYQYVTQKGGVYQFDLSGLLTNIISPLGFTVHYLYQNGKLSEINDGHGRGIKIAYYGNDVEVSYLDAQGQWQTTTLTTNGEGLLMSMRNALGDTTTITYGNEPENQGLPIQLKNPAGGTVDFEYSQLSTPGNQKMPVISKVISQSHTTYPSIIGGGQEMSSPQIVEYAYTINDSDHNYLGKGLSSWNDPTRDQMMELGIGDAGYQYTTIEKTLAAGKEIRTVRVYDHFHRQLNEEVLINGQRVSYQENHFNDPADTPFYNLSVFYNQPISTLKENSGVDGLYALDKYKQTKESFGYNVNGNLIKHIDDYGMTKEYQYAVPGDSGYERSLLQETDIPAVIKNLKSRSPEVTKNTIQTIKRDIAGKNYLFDLIKRTDYGVLKDNEFVATLREDKQLDLDPASEGYLTSYIKELVNVQKASGSNQLYITASNDEASKNLKLNEAGPGYLIIDKRLEAKSTENTIGKQAPSLLKQGKSYLSRYTGDVMIEEDESGLQTAYTYDAIGRIATETRNANTSEAYTIRYSYGIDASTSTTSVTASYPDGYIEKVIFDSTGRQITSLQSSDRDSNTLIPISATRYNVDGTEQSEIDYSTGNALTTRFEYSPLAKKTVSINPDGSADVVSLDAGHNRAIKYHLSSNGQETGGDSSSLCHLPGTETATGCQASTIGVISYDNESKQIHKDSIIIDAQAKKDTGTLVYTNPIHQSKIENFVSTFNQGKRVSAGEMAQFIDEAITAKESYSSSYLQLDGFHNVAYKVDEQGRRIDKEYDDQGNVIKQIDKATGNVYEMSYDYLGNLTQLDVTESNAQHYTLGQKTYNGLGLELSTFDASGHQTEFSYDDLGQLISTQQPNGSIINYQYDDLNRPVSTQSGNSYIQYDYQSTYPFLSNKVSGVLNGSNSEVSYDYDLYQQPTRTTTVYNQDEKTQSIINQEYNAQGQFISGSDSLSNVSGQVSYDSLGRKIAVDYGNGHSITYRYNAQNQVSEKIIDQLHYYYDYNLLGLIDQLIIKRDHQDASDSDTLMSFNYEYDQYGRIKQVISDHTKSAYTYTDLGQLNTFGCQETSLPSQYCPRDESGNIILNEQYHYDALNNITQIDQVLLANDQQMNNTISFEYNSPDPTQLTRYRNPIANKDMIFNYDTNGNMLNDQDGNQLVYDAFDNLIRVTTPAGEVNTYEYNVLSQQMAQSQTNKDPVYYYYNGDSITNEKQGDKVTHFIDGGQIKDGQWQYYLQDARNNVISTLDDSGTLSGYKTYTPFGYSKDIDSQTKSFDVLDIDQLDKGYNGMLTDRMTGNQFLGNGYRAYNPILHRFMKHDSESPYGDGGINGYIYATNDPINQFDPTGHMSEAGQMVMTGAFGLLSLVGMGMGIGEVMATTKALRISGKIISGTKSLAIVAGRGAESAAAGTSIAAQVKESKGELDKAENFSTISDHLMVAGLGINAIEAIANTSLLVNATSNLMSSERAAKGNYFVKKINSIRKVNHTLPVQKSIVSSAANATILSSAFGLFFKDMITDDDETKEKRQIYAQLGLGISSVITGTIDIQARKGLRKKMDRNYESTENNIDSISSMPHRGDEIPYNGNQSDSSYNSLVVPVTNNENRLLFSSEASSNSYISSCSPKFGGEFIQLVV